MFVEPEAIDPVVDPVVSVPLIPLIPFIEPEVPVPFVEPVVLPVPLVLKFELPVVPLPVRFERVPVRREVVPLVVPLPVVPEPLVWALVIEPLVLFVLPVVPLV